jgi:hypothetical protein
MRKYLNDEHKAMFDRYFAKALHGGCDARQAEQIAKERTLFDITRASAAISYVRQRLMGDISQAPRRDFGFTQNYD